MWSDIKNMVIEASATIGKYATFVQGLMPLLGRWLVFVICVPITVRAWQSLRRHDWHGVAVALLILLCFAMLFLFMVALFWEVIAYKWGL